MKSQLKVCFSLLTVITAVFLLIMDPFFNGTEPTKPERTIRNVYRWADASEERIDGSDNNSVGTSMVAATDTTTQVWTLPHLNDIDNHSNRSVSASVTMATQVRPQSQSKNNGDSHHGYVLAYNYYDQQTAAMKNILSLQCWAAQLNMPVVEPFMVKSMFNTPLRTDVRSLLRFSDFYDMDQWNEGYVRPNSFLPFASWEDFVHNAPRDVILVQILDFEKFCSFSKIKQWYTSFYKQNHFRIVKEVCIDSLRKHKRMTTDGFNHLVLNKYYKLHNVTVIFDWWRGISLEEYSHTITIPDGKCDRLTLLRTDLQLNASKKVSQDTDLYVHKYLKNRSYISVMLRLEYPIITAKETGIVSKCTKRAHDAWKSLKKDNKLNVTFLAWDIGRFGSETFERNKYRWKKYRINQNAHILFTAIYRRLTSEKDWENSFVDVSRSTNPGYIALLQMSIAARARCIVLVGGGSFHAHALNMYKDLHPQPQTQCIANLNKYCD